MTALGLALTACGASGEEPAKAAAPASPAEPETPLGSPSPTQTPTTGTVSNGKWTTTAICPKNAKLPPFTGAAADTFGADNVMDAYCEIGDFFYTDAIRNVAPKPSWDGSEFDFVYPRLGPEAEEQFRAKLARALKQTGTMGKPWEQVNALSYFDIPVDELGMTMSPGAATQIGGGVSKADTEVFSADGTDFLRMRFSVTNNVIMKKGNAEWVVPMERQVGVDLMMNPESAPGDAQTWIIGSYNTNFQVKQGDEKPLGKFLQSSFASTE